MLTNNNSNLNELALVDNIKNDEGADSFFALTVVPIAWFSFLPSF